MLWDMEEAGGNWSDELEHVVGNVLWVQVGLSNTAKQAGLPVAQFVACNEKVLERIGVVDLTGVQLMLPVGKAPARRTVGLDPILAASDPANSTIVPVEIDGGEDDTCIRNVTQIIDELTTACARDEIRFGSAAISQSSSYLFNELAGMDRTAWMGQSVGRIETQVSVREFSLDTSGHLAAHIARSCQLAGVTSSVLITLRRDVVALDLR